MHESIPNSVTRADVARAAGVSTYTVSQSLAGKAGPSEATRRRVLAVAEQLGYRPNAAASLLSKRRGSSGARDRLSVVFLDELGHDRTNFLTACEELGIHGTVEKPSSFGTPEDASRILWNRGVDGLVISSGRDHWNREQRARFDWKRFSVVKRDRGWPDIPCHLVRHSPFDYMARTLELVMKSGYRRIAVLMHESEAAVDDDARFGAILNVQHRTRPRGVRLEWKDMSSSSGLDDAGRLAWLRKFKPDALVFFHQVFAEAFLDKLPEGLEGVGIAAVLINTDEGSNLRRISGCDIQALEHSRRTLNLLLNLIGRGERGFASQPLEDVIEPIWVQGDTLPIMSTAQG